MEIVSALATQLSWSHFVELLPHKDGIVLAEYWTTLPPITGVGAAAERDPAARPRAARSPPDRSDTGGLELTV